MSQYIQSILPYSIPPIAYAVLNGEDHWQGSILVATVFGLDTILRLGSTTAEPARAIGEDKRKVRRLNGSSDKDTRSERRVSRECIRIDTDGSQVKASPQSRWSWLWLFNAILTVGVCEHLFNTHPASTRDISYARYV